MNDFGGKLRQARERRGISLRQIAASTKISVAALEALERNDVSKLPGGIFSRGFVRSYATEVGLDPDVTVREFLDRFHGEAPAPAAQPAPPARQVPQPVRDTPVRAPLAQDESSFESQQRVATVLLKLFAVSLPLVGIILYLTLGRGPAAGSDANAGQGAGAEREGAGDTPAAPQQGDTPAGTVVPPVSPSRPAVAAASGPPAAATADQPLVLELHPTGPCWVSLTVDGQTVVSRLMQAGEKDVRRIRESAVIEVGDAGTFAFTVDGRPGRSLGQSGQVKTARISRATLNEYLR
jgi:cytoskeleton protein RodZ